MNNTFLRTSKFIRSGLSESELLLERVMKFSFFFIFARNRILSICSLRLPIRGKVVFSTVSSAVISFPLFPAAFQQLILESLQVFHNSNGIFASYRPLSTTDISGVLHISNCDFITRKRRNVLMNWTMSRRYSQRCRYRDTEKLKINNDVIVNPFTRH